jgi:glycosyltransferase 2 family protein
MGNQNKKIISIFISIAASLIFLYLALRDVNWFEFKNSFYNIKLEYLIVFMVFQLIMISFRGFRFYYLIQPVKKHRFIDAFSTSLIGFASILVLPLRLGEFVRPYLLAKKGDLKKDFSPLLGITIVERVIDGLLISLILCFVLFVKFFEGNNPQWVFPTIILSFFIFFISLILLVSSIFYPKKIFNILMTLTLLKYLSKKFSKVKVFTEKLLSIYKGVVNGFSTVLHPKYFLPFLFFTFSYWIINGFSIYLLALSFNLSISVICGFSVMGFIVIGIFIPSAPGFIGNFHQFAKLGLAIFLTEKIVNSKGMALIISLHGLQLLSYLLLSGLGIFLYRKSNLQKN